MKIQRKMYSTFVEQNASHNWELQTIIQLQHLKQIEKIKIVFNPNYQQ